LLFSIKSVISLSGSHFR